jgi:hypothetical protein
VTSRLCIGTSCPDSDASLANRIRPGTDEVLVVTSITAYNFSGSLPPADSYGMLNAGACSTGVFPRRFGIPVITIDGRSTTHVTLQPGVLVFDLIDTERVCFTSLAQSTSIVDVTLHGYLTARP